MKLKGVLLLIGLAALLPAGANAATFRGVVVGKQHGLLLVATPSGAVQAIRGHAAIGSRPLGSTVIGRATRARIHGVVVERVGSTMFLSSNRHLLAVHMGRTLAANAPSPAAPAPGAVVNTTVGVKDNGELDEQNEDEVGQVNGTIPVQATVTAVGNGTVTLSVNGQSLTVNLPAGLTLPASVVGQTVTLNLSLAGDDDQGDDDGGHGDHHGDGGGGGGRRLALPTSTARPSGRPRSRGAAAARSEQLYARHHRMVTGLCRALLRDAGEAEDAAQQVFLSAHRSLLNGAVPRESAAWLATIARNECWARIRGRMREPLPSEAADDVAGGEDPVDEAIRRADLAALWRAIRALPKQQREALLLREFGGLRYDELAAALAVSEPAIESLLFRARTRLRAQLESAAAALAPLARLIASGGGPAVAAKAAALGLGAAAVTGTAVVAPEMLEHRPHHTPPPASQRLGPSARRRRSPPCRCCRSSTTSSGASPRRRPSRSRSGMRAAERRRSASVMTAAR